MSHSNLDPTRRFSNRVADYVRYRPGYPPEMIELLRAEIGFTADWIVGDIGAGTGIATDLLLSAGNSVIAVEPNAEMRAAAESRHAGRPGFRSVDGTAEATTLDDNSVDLVFCAQAFHWFDQPAAAREFRRILREKGWVVIVWNDRRTELSPAMAEYDRLLHAYGTDYKQVRSTTTTVEALHDLFGAPFQLRTLPNHQVFDLDGLIGRAMSASYAPRPGEPGHDALMAGLRNLFSRHQQDNRLLFELNTEIFYGQISRHLPNSTSQI